MPSPAWYRLHLVTWITALIVGAAMTWAQVPVMVRHFGEPADTSWRGWPLAFAADDEPHASNTISCGALLAVTMLVVERWRRGDIGRLRRSYETAVHTMVVLVVFIAVSDVNPEAFFRPVLLDDLSVNDWRLWTRAAGYLRWLPAPLDSPLRYGRLVTFSLAVSVACGAIATWTFMTIAAHSFAKLPVMRATIPRYSAVNDESGCSTSSHRPWWCVHSLTLIVALTVALACLQAESDAIDGITIAWGWPLIRHEWLLRFDSMQYEHWLESRPLVSRVATAAWLFTIAVMNFVWCITIIASTALVVELACRRRKFGPFTIAELMHCVLVIAVVMALMRIPGCSLVVLPADLRLEFGRHWLFVAFPFFPLLCGMACAISLLLRIASSRMSAAARVVSNRRMLAAAGPIS